jgi:hypothetical protein
LIEGKVVNGVPLIEWELAGTVWPATIDTGFNGGLELRYSLQPRIPNHRFGSAVSVLAGGIAIQEDLFVVEAPFDDRTFRTYATFAPGDGSLIGTAMLEEYRLTVDFPAECLMLERED